MGVTVKFDVPVESKLIPPDPESTVTDVVPVVLPTAIDLSLDDVPIFIPEAVSFVPTFIDESLSVFISTSPLPTVKSLADKDVAVPILPRSTSELGIVIV